jgi:hypothetical protein
MRLTLTACALPALAICALASPLAAPSNNVTRRGDSMSLLSGVEALDNAIGALQVMQEQHYEPWLGTWPKAIDWTAAVMGSHVAGALHSMSRGLGQLGTALTDRENAITLYFSETIGAYFGQEAIAIRQQAYDDMLWVVLQWLDAITFIDLHSGLHFSPRSSGLSQQWHGNTWTAAFAHRARVFWELASQGWDTELCGGGMTWNPRLEPYKNAITNELYIAASIQMYLHFPGDSNDSPFREERERYGLTMTGARAPHDPVFLQAAKDAYEWLKYSGMMNSRGLYADGFHISGWRKNGSVVDTKCDRRCEAVYTYNQGVLLTGQLGLWQVTGDQSYLDDGHKLIKSVIAGTGYNLDDDTPQDSVARLKPGELPPWHGLGRAGVLEENCDASGTCSQDGQAFKGIFFHHLSAFCSPLVLVPGAAPAVRSAPSQGALDQHAETCRAYTGWVRHNAMAALLTRDSSGRFGMWWTAGILGWDATARPEIPEDVNSPPTGIVSFDYRIKGIPNDELWVGDLPPPSDNAKRSGNPVYLDRLQQQFMDGAWDDGDKSRYLATGDFNDRGRGRTVETQGGGVAVLRALWEISQL